MIQNYDTNGLIFVLDPEHKEIQSTIDSEEYKKAVLNVMNSQADGFFCIPIISAPRVRANRNDAISRAVYNNSDGAITYIARRGVFEDEDDIVLIPNSEIVHIQGTSSLLEALKIIFTPNSNGKYNFVITVDGTKQQPIALFSPDQIIQKYCKKEIKSRLFDICDQEKTRLILDFAEKISKRQLVSLEDIEQIKIGEISLLKDAIDKTEARITNIKSRNAEDDLEAKDIMTWGAQAITISDSLPNEMSVKIVCLANDFSNLIARNTQGELVPEIVNFDKESDKIDRRRSKQIKPKDKLETILTNFSNLNPKNAALIIEVDENILSGEGPMKWPGIITNDDLLSPEVFNKIGGMCTRYEKDLQRLIFDITGCKRLDLPFPSGRYEKRSVEKMNLGDLWYLLKDKKKYDCLLSAVSFVKDVDKGIFLEAHENIKDIHNEIKHCLLTLNVMTEQDLTEIASYRNEELVKMSGRAVMDSMLVYADNRLQMAKNMYNDCMNKDEFDGAISKSNLPKEKGKKVNKTNVSSGKSHKHGHGKQSTKNKQKTSKKKSVHEIIAALELEFARLTKEWKDLPEGMGQVRVKRNENMARRSQIKEELERLKNK